jgi:hypothetical protein
MLSPEPLPVFPLEPLPGSPPTVTEENYERWCRDTFWHGYKWLRGRAQFRGVPNWLLATTQNYPPRFYGDERDPA